MAAARDQAARILREELEVTGNEGHKASEIAEPMRPHPSDETTRRGPDVTDRPGVAKPVVPEAAVAPAAKPQNRKKTVFFGVVALLALAAAAYGVHWFLVGRFHVSTDDAYVRTNNTVLGA